MQYFCRPCIKICKFQSQVIICSKNNLFLPLLFYPQPNACDLALLGQTLTTKRKLNVGNCRFGNKISHIKTNMSECFLVLLSYKTNIKAHWIKGFFYFLKRNPVCWSYDNFPSFSSFAFSEKNIFSSSRIPKCCLHVLMN